jgi:drug/metabolite transporter (DMT)-like permease
MNRAFDASGPQAALHQRRALALVCLSPALVASNYIIARAAHGEITPHVMSLVRWSVALVLMLAVCRRELGTICRAMRTEGWRTLVLGALGMWVCGAFVYLGAATTSAANIGLMYAATPVAIAIASARLLNEPLSLRQCMGMALATTGVLIVIFKGQLLYLLDARPVAGDGWILTAAAGWVAYSVLQQRWPTVLTPPQRLAAITAGGVLVLLPFTLLEVQVLVPPAQPWPTARGLALATLAGVVPGFLAYQAHGFIIQALGAMRAGLVMYLSPIYAALIAWSVLGESPQWFHVVGAALILPSIYAGLEQSR